MNDHQPDQTFIVEDLETLRALAEPLRMQIYEALLMGPASVRQIAEGLGLAPSRLYYHINHLEKLGLIRVVETRMVSNMVEKYYRARAYSIELAPGLLDFHTDEGKENITEYLLNSIDATREDLLRSLQARMFELKQGAVEKTRNVMLSRTTGRIPDEKAVEFHRRFQELIEEFGTFDSELSPGEMEGFQQYALLVAFYPSFYYKEADSGAANS